MQLVEILHGCIASLLLVLHLQIQCVQILNVFVASIPELLERELKTILITITSVTTFR